MVATRRGWLDKKPSSGKSGSWQRRWVVLEQTSEQAIISWYADASDYPHNPKGDFKLRTFADPPPARATVKTTKGSEGFAITNGKASLPLRHSLAEHQEAWVKNIEDAIEGNLSPGPEDEAAISTAMKNMSTNATEGRDATVTAGDDAKVVSCIKSWGHLGLTVKNSMRGAGVVVTKLGDGSMLEMAGLNVGDTIIMIGRTMVTDHASTIKAIDQTKPEEMLTLTMASPTFKVRVDKTKGDVGLSLTNNPSGVGVTVCGLTDNSVAALVGMEVQHEILAVNGHEVNDHGTAVKCMDDAARWVDMIVFGKNITTTGCRTLMVPKPSEAGKEWHEQIRFGATADSTPAVPCVTVAAVEKGSPAAEAGLVVGSLVHAINNIPVRDEGSAKVALAASTTRALLLTRP